MPESPITDSLRYLRESDQIKDTYSDEDGGHYIDRSGERTFEIVRAWHNDTHRGAFLVCDEQPCHAINRPPA